MKKIHKIAALAVAAFCLCGTTACKNEVPPSVDEKTVVRLGAITGADAVGTVEADYFLLAEPAATAQSKKGYSIKGDLQRLYGGENGYPQAVLVAKKELVETQAAWLQSFTAQLRDSMQWLSTATGTELVEAVQSHMADKAANTSLKAPLLSSEVVSRCGIRFTYASADKEEVNDFLRNIRGVDANAAANPQDGFYWDYTPTETQPEMVSPKSEITVCMPDGAPALALAKMMRDDTDSDGVTYKVVDSGSISAQVTYSDEAKNADLCVLPITAASKLLGSGEKYIMLGTVTHGNLYLISKDGEAITAENISSLQGKKIGVLQMNNVPGLTLKTVLVKYGLIIGVGQL